MATTSTNSSRVYEDYEPPSDLVQESGCDTILVHLPGFKKEQLRVQLTVSGVLKVSGERPVGGNKWRRFFKEFPVPSYCDTKGISAKFEDGVLYIRQPKIIVISQAPPPTNQAQQDIAARDQPAVAPQPPVSRPQPPPPQPPTPSEFHEEGEDATGRQQKEEMVSGKDHEDKTNKVTSGGGSGLFKELSKSDKLKRLGVCVLMVVVLGLYVSHFLKLFTRKDQQKVLDYNPEL